MEQPAPVYDSFPRKRIAIVGAGVSGICSVKSCLESGLEPVCLEQSEDLGGLWRYKPGTTMQGEGSVMKGTTANTSKEMMAFSDFPPPADFPNFMHHTRVMEYLRLYVDHFQLAPHFRFHHRITRIQRSEDYRETGRWDVYYEILNCDLTPKVQSESFDGVMLCVGHHTYPYLPDIPGQEEFKGQIEHSHGYRSANGYEEKTVVVVGMGNSAGDIAVGLGREIAEKVYLSVRRRVWVFHRISLFGMPYDYFFFNRLFFWLLAHATSILNYITIAELNRRMDHNLFGINPEQGPFCADNFINDEFASSYASGAVTLKPGIDRLTENKVRFTDGTSAENVDVLILCTGYTIRFPFLEEGVIDVHENNAPLYKHMYPAHMEHPTLAVIGMIQPLGSINPIAELQSRVFAKVMLKESLLPLRAAMDADIQIVKQRMRKRYVASRRHTVQVDGTPYMDELAELIGAQQPSFSKILLSGRFNLLGKMCLYGSLPYEYRLYGPDAWEGAAGAITAATSRQFQPYTDVTTNGFEKPIGHMFSGLTFVPTVLKAQTLDVRASLKREPLYPVSFVILMIFIAWMTFSLIYNC